MESQYFLFFDCFISFLSLKIKNYAILHISLVSKHTRNIIFHLTCANEKIHFNHLIKCHSIKHLKCHRSLEYDHIAQFSSLISLSLCNNYQITNLSNLTNLIKLNLKCRITSSSFNIDNISSLIKLTRLNMKTNENIQTITMLTNLYELSLFENNHIWNLASLTRLTKLYLISINVINSIKLLTNLLYLNIKENNDTITNIQYLSKLTHLKIIMNNSLTTLENLRNLKTLKLMWNMSLKNINSLLMLTKLELVHDFGIFDISELTNLRLLNISENTKLRKIPNNLCLKINLGSDTLICLNRKLKCVIDE